MMMRPPIRFLPFAIFAAVILIVAVGLHHPRRSVAMTNWVGRSVPDTYLPLLRDGTAAADAHFKSSAWRGRPYIVHFFASWCPDCRAEQEELLTLQAAHIPIVGIVFQDRAGKVGGYLQANGDPYVAVALDPQGQTAARWGVTAIPATFIVDSQGVVRWQSDSAIPSETAENIIMPLWEELKPAAPIR